MKPIFRDMSVTFLSGCHAYVSLWVTSLDRIGLDALKKKSRGELRKLQNIDNCVYGPIIGCVTESHHLTVITRTRILLMGHDFLVKK